MQNKKISQVLKELKTKKKVCESNIKSFSDNAAINYDKEHNSVYQKKVFSENTKKILRSFKKANLKIIDIACGTGGMTYLFFKYSKNSKIFCLDISKDMLDVFKKKLSFEEKKRAKFICDDATNYFKKCKEKFDIIVVEGSLHHIFDYLDLLDLSSKRLKDDGFYYITGEPLPKQEYNYYLGELIRTWDRAFYNYKDNKLKLFLYLLYAPFNFLSPVINSKYIKKIKDKLLHGGVIEKNSAGYTEYWGYKKGLDLNKILEIFKKNNIKVIKVGIGSGYRYKWVKKMAQFLKVNSSFDLMGVKIENHL